MVAECPAAAVWAACTKSPNRAIYPEARRCRAEGSDSQRASGATHRDALFFGLNVAPRLLAALLHHIFRAALGGPLGD